MEDKFVTDADRDLAERVLNAMREGDIIRPATLLNFCWTPAELSSCMVGTNAIEVERALDALCQCGWVHRIGTVAGPLFKLVFDRMFLTSWTTCTIQQYDREKHGFIRGAFGPTYGWVLIHKEEML